ncbi:MAG: thioredoxin family protein [Bacteroidetes bacterium]|nr:thioredoxin family protein [Bacteroidota bacterium]
MIKKTFLLLTMAVCIGVFPSLSQTAGTGYKVGDNVTDFKLANIDGSNFAFASIPDAKGYIVIFTCNHCPFSIAYEKRIIALNEKYASQGYPVIAINSNDPAIVPDDSFEKMQEHAAEVGFNFPYVFDETQEVAKRFGATRTPHVFILSKSDIALKVEYIGAIDDNTDNPEAATKHYVAEAVDELLAGSKVTTNFTKAVGCTIKWKKTAEQK